MAPTSASLTPNSTSPTNSPVAPKAPATTGPTSAAVPTPPQTAPKTGIAAAVNKALGQTLAIPPGLKAFNTDTLGGTGYFHGLIYSETSARKSTTAAKFGTSDEVLIVLCRQPEQLLPLQNLGYRVLHAQDADALIFALNYPEAAAAQLLNWPEWATNPNRTLVIDDVTEAVNLLLEANSVNENTGAEFKDMRKVYGEAGKDLRAIVSSLRRKPMHLILIALAKVNSTPLTNEERIGPDLPPSMLGFLTTELEFTFFIKTSNWKMITDRTFINYTGEDEHGKTKIFKREIFAKNKLPVLLTGLQVLNLEEDLDVRKLWEKVKAAAAKQLERQQKERAQAQAQAKAQAELPQPSKEQS